MDGICRAVTRWDRGYTGAHVALDLGGLLLLRMTSLHKVQTFTSGPARLKRTPRDQLCVLTTVQRLGCVIAACMYPGTIAGCALSLEHGGFAHDEILSSCRRGTCSLVTFSSGLPRRRAVVCCLLCLGWHGWMDCKWFMRRRETRRLFWAARLLMGRARACGVDRRLARFLSGPLNDRRDTS